MQLSNIFILSYFYAVITVKSSEPLTMIYCINLNTKVHSLAKQWAYIFIEMNIAEHWIHWKNWVKLTDGRLDCIELCAERGLSAIENKPPHKRLQETPRHKPTVYRIVPDMISLV